MKMSNKCILNRFADNEETISPIDVNNRIIDTENNSIKRSNAFRKMKYRKLSSNDSKKSLSSVVDMA